MKQDGSFASKYLVSTYHLDARIVTVLFELLRY